MSFGKVIVIGGSGFLGSRLIARFKTKSIDYKCYDINPGFDAKDSSYLDVESIGSRTQFAGAETIINLAAVHRDDVRPLSRYDDVNVQGAVNVCEAARASEVNKIIFTSSVAIYGFAPENTDESGEPDYFNDYGRTKFLAEQVYREWQSEDPKNRMLTIVRPSVIFGEGNRGNVYNLFKQIASRKFIMIGGGKNSKSMAYVENVAAFMEHSLSFDSGLHIYNYIDKPDFDMNTLVAQVRKILFDKEGVGPRLPKLLGMVLGYLADFFAKLTNKNLPISSIRVKKFMGTTKFSSSVGETGFVPPVTIQEGLLKTLRYEFQEDNSGEKTFKTE